MPDAGGLNLKRDQLEQLPVFPTTFHWDKTVEVLETTTMREHEIKAGERK